LKATYPTDTPVHAFQRSLFSEIDLASMTVNFACANPLFLNPDEAYPAITALYRVRKEVNAESGVYRKAYERIEDILGYLVNRHDAQRAA